MPKFESRTRFLPPARLSRTEFKAIEEAIGPEFPGSREWNFWSGHTNITNTSLEEILDEVKDIRHLTDFEFAVKSPDADITLSAGSEGCILEYECSQALLGTISAKVRTIEGIFRDNRRRTAYIPRPITSLPLVKHIAAGPSFQVGAPGFQLTLDWNVIWQNVVTNWLSHFGTALISVVLGIILGWILRAVF